MQPVQGLNLGLSTYWASGLVMKQASHSHHYGLLTDYHLGNTLKDRKKEMALLQKMIGVLARNKLVLKITVKRFYMSN